LIEAEANTIQELATLPMVVKIVANFKVAVPKSQTGAGTEFMVCGNSSTWNLKKVRAPEVWEKLGVTGRNVRVATTDTGVDITHPEIAGTLWTDHPGDPFYPGGWIEFDVYGNIVQGSVPHDTEGHGTETYGLILGQTTGMAPNAIGMHALVTPDLRGTLAQVIAGLEWVISPFDQNRRPAGAPADVSLHSWGVRGGYEDEFIEPIRNMWYSGHFVVAIIGNEGEETSNSPGDVYECIAVGATDVNDNVWLNSSGRVIYKAGWKYPPSAWPDQWVKPDLSAPGINVIVPLPGGRYGQDSGTSFAAPHVAGAAVLMLSANPTLTVQKIEDVLKETAVWYDRYSSQRPDTRYGWGRIDAYRAVLFAGFKARLIVPAENVITYDIASAIKDALAKIRVHVEIELRSASEIVDTVWGVYWNKTWSQAPGYGWDMVWYEFNSASETLNQNLRSHYWANMTPLNWGYNIMCWNNTSADKLLRRGMQTSVATDKKSDLGKWQKVFMHDPPCIIIYYPSTPMCAKGIAFNLHHPVLSNRYVRQAIAHAINYENIENILLDSGIEVHPKPRKAPIHPDTTYTYNSTTVYLYNDDLLPFQTNVTQAMKYMEMWWYSQKDEEVMKGPRGDGDFSGYVELDDFYIWVRWWGKYTYKEPKIKFLPGQDVDPDWDNNGFVEMPDFYKWREAWGFYYPENSTRWIWSRSPVTPLGAPEYPAIYVDPASIEKTTYEPGTNFTVSIRTNYTGTDVTGWQLTLYYNPLVLQGVNVTNGDLITKEKDSSAQFIAGTFNNTAGRLSLTGAFFSFIYEPAPLTSGPGILAKITFKVVGWGDSGILLGDKTKLIGFTEDGWGTKYDIIDASTDPNHIQNGFFSNLVLTIRPNAPGKFTRWTPYPSGTPNWQCVDEANPNDDADYVYWTPQPSKQDSYSLEDHTTETRNITNVRVVMYAKLASADDDQITIQLVINGMTYEGATVNPTTTYAKYTSDWPMNPSTGSAWTWSDIDALEGGFKCVKVGQTSPEHRITQLYVEVTLPRSYE